MKLTMHQKKILCFALISNYVIYLCMHLFFYTTYESQLDIMMQAGIYGVSGQSSAYLLYMNVLLGWALKSLTLCLPSFNWYYMYLMIACVFSLSLISYLLIKRAPNKVGFTASFVISCFLGYECYVLPGVMKTAGVMAAALLFVFTDGYEACMLGQLQRRLLLFLLAGIGSMTQLSAFLVVLFIGSAGIACYYGIMYFQKEIKEDSVIRKKDWQKNIVSLLGSLCFIVLFLYVVDDFSYRAHEREMAVSYRGTICRIYGYGMNEYDENFKNLYGIDEAGYQAIKAGNFAFQTQDRWDVLKEMTTTIDLSWNKIDTYFKSVPIGFFKYGMFYLFIIMEFFQFFSCTIRKKLLIYMEIAWLLLVTFIAYFFHAWNYNWIVTIIIFAVVLPLMLALKDANETGYQHLWVYLTVFSIILYSKFSSGMISSVAEDDMLVKVASADQSKCNIMDLTAYLKRYSAQHYYVPGLLNRENVKISNGAYLLLDGYENKLIGSLENNTSYEWIYNPKSLTLEAVWIE